MATSGLAGAENKAWRLIAADRKPTTVMTCRIASIVATACRINIELRRDYKSNPASQPAEMGVAR